MGTERETLARRLSLALGTGVRRGFLGVLKDEPGEEGKGIPDRTAPAEAQGEASTWISSLGGGAGTSLLPTCHCPEAANWVSVTFPTVVVKGHCPCSHVTPNISDSSDTPVSRTSLRRPGPWNLWKGSCRMPFGASPPVV